jgi:L-alanine-DL-glutamate epimerase-like enolase superfamily enzyme
MRVTDVRTMLLEGPDPHGIGGRPRTWQVLLVRVETDSDVYGLGEAPAFMGVREALAYGRDWLIGRDPIQAGPFTRMMLYGSMLPGDPQTSPTATPTGPIAWAASGIEMALCDLAGRAFRAPVHALLGGAYRDRVRVYIDRSGVTNPTQLDAWERAGADASERDFGFLKFDLEQIAPDLATDRWNRTLNRSQLAAISERLSAVRKGAGDGVDIAIDAHMMFDLTSSLAVVPVLESAGIAWFEDPTPITNPDALADLRSRCRVPICVGEMFVPEQFRLFVDRGACDIVHPDLLFVGGVRAAHAVGQYADLHYLPLALHNNGSAMSTVAAAHVAAATPNFLGLEYHFLDAKWIGEVVRREGVELFASGTVPMTDAPGFGVELDADVCRRHLAPGESLF